MKQQQIGKVQETSRNRKWLREKNIIFTLFTYLFAFLGLHLRHMELPRLGGLIRATAAGLHHSHSNSRSKLQLQPMPQLTATLDP